MNYYIKHHPSSTNVSFSTINLPSSKSEANRMLIIKALTTSGDTKITNLSTARDTQTLHSLLNKTDETLFDVLDAGTTMRFLTAYLAVTTKHNVEITGTDRMKQRPIGILVEALNKVGCEITYKGKEGFPPLLITPFKKQLLDRIDIPGNVSSQYISALLMIAPILPDGLNINVLPPIYSQPYIDMTLGLMQKASINVIQANKELIIKPMSYKPIDHSVESDWSGASYWFSYIALSATGTKLKLIGLKQTSLQGDQAIINIMSKLGVATVFTDNGVHLEKIASVLPQDLTLNFTEFPDLAQTVVACCAALKVNLKMTGLESLRIKETDRIAALHNEISKFDCSLVETESGHWEMQAKHFELKEGTIIETYEDHRMAMSFAPLALVKDLLIKDISVVNKSYPSFWEDLKSAGFELTDN